MNLIDAFLFDREKRVYHQEKLLKKYANSTLVTIRINYPGLNKSNYINDDIVKIIYNEIITFYNNIILYDEIYKNREGLISHILLDLDIVKTKEIMIEIEEKHVLGRYVDIDVYSLEDGKVITISRTDLNKSPRICFICNTDAKICSRSQNHSIEDIFLKFQESYLEFNKKNNYIDKLSYNYSQLALKAMISEVSTYPSFGLVSPISQGSHKDMDYYTFLDSSIAITPYLREMYRLGYTFYNPKYIFNAIRNVGKECEEKMFDATNGVNTHKGMIFIMGIVMASIGKCNYHNYPFEKIQDIIKSMVEDILKDFDNIKNKKNLTHGEKLYLKYGFTGIRGQVKDGLDILFSEIMPKYINEKLEKNKLYTQILIHLMSSVEDSTIVYRHDVETLKKVQIDAKNLLAIGGVYTKEGLNKIESLEREYINYNISPGGCADLLAVSIFLMNIKKQMDANN